MRLRSLPLALTLLAVLPASTRRTCTATAYDAADNKSAQSAQAHAAAAIVDGAFEYQTIPGGGSEESGDGLASKYVGDEGIENDPDVVFVESFEEGSLEGVTSRWEDCTGVEIMSLSTDVPPGSSGQHSLLMTHTGGEGTGGHLYRRLLPGYEQLYVRFYVKFDPACYSIHHFVHMGGYNPSTPWPQGGAGERPSGDDRFTTGVEPYGSAWRWDFYTYWMEMRGSPDGRFWGNDFVNDGDLEVGRGEWICVELMMEMNDPLSGRTGEQAIWINGELWAKDGQVISHLGEGFPRGNWIWDSFIPDPNGTPFEGFRWRNAEELNLNFLWLLLYITQAPPGYVSRVWFDDVVVATSYIGPLGTGNQVDLDGRPSDQSIHLNWTVTGTLPVTSTWRIDYYSQTVTSPLSVTGILSPTRAYTLTGLTNYAWYTITLNAMLDSAPLLTDTVRVMPTDIFVYLPVVLKAP